MIRTILTSVIGYFAIQCICTCKLSIVPNKKEYIFYNILSVFCLYSLLNFFLWNYQINFLIVITLLYIVSVAMYFVHEFRGTNLNFSDIRSIGTAKEVASGYTYKLKFIQILPLIIIILEYLLQIFLYKIYPFVNYHKTLNSIDSINIDIYRFFWHEVEMAACFFISFYILRDKITKSYYDYSLFSGENEGYIYNFISSMPIFHKSKHSYIDTILARKNYIFNIIKRITRGDIKNTQLELNIIKNKYKKYVNDHKETPHVLVVMNESFGSVHTRTEHSATTTPFYDNLRGVIKGKLFVNTFGGGTANTEFEFLTGMSIGNYPYPVMPYNNFVKRDKYSLARYFANLGYETYAMHPYTSTNYNRNKVYKYFGFQNRLFYDDFRSKKFLRNYVDDISAYEELVRRYNEVKNEGKKIFAFLVTMQNHSGYKSFDEYIDLMRASDSALEKLIDYFEKEEEHVVILFFGDHNASFGTDLNKKLYDTNVNYEFTDAFYTPLLIYDNKNKLNRMIHYISANFLSIELLKKCDLPFDMLHDSLQNVYKQYQSFNFHKSKTRDSVIDYIVDDDFQKLEAEYLK